MAGNGKKIRVAAYNPTQAKPKKAPMFNRYRHSDDDKLIMGPLHTIPDETWERIFGTGSAHKLNNQEGG